MGAFTDSGLSNVFRMVEKKRVRRMFSGGHGGGDHKCISREMNESEELCYDMLGEEPMMSMMVVPLASVSFWLPIWNHHLVLPFTSCCYRPRAFLPLHMFVFGTRVCAHIPLAVAEYVK
jgi:hypothetical protein